MPSLETIDAQLFVSAAEAAEILGIARRSLNNRVEVGTVKPSHKMPGKTGSYLFDRAYIEQLAADERGATQRRSALAAAPSAPEDYAIQDQKTGAVIMESRRVDLDGGDAA